VSSRQGHEVSPSRWDSGADIRHAVDAMRERIDGLRAVAASVSAEESRVALLAELAAARDQLRTAEAAAQRQAEEMERLRDAGRQARAQIDRLLDYAAPEDRVRLQEVLDMLQGADVTAGVSPAPGDQRLAHAVVDLTLASRSPVVGGDTLTEVAIVCQGAFSQPVAVSIALGEPAAPGVVATGSKLAQNLDGLQITAGEGPSHQCWTERAVVHSSALVDDPRWPRLSRLLAGHEVCSAISAPLEREGEVIGSLNVYSVSPRLVDDASLEAAELLASTVAEMLHEGQVKRQLQDAALQLETALRSRATIDQAKGIIMARSGCSADDAFRQLADASSSANVKLREIAERLVRDAGRGLHQDQ
jgi:hypothetical protein